MRIFLTLAIMASFITTVLAVAPPIKVDIIGTPTQHQVQWTTRPCYNYTVECSLNLQTWTQVGDMRSGNGDWMSYDFSVNGARTYYRVREHDLGFWFRPCAGEKCYKEGGVIFGFDLTRALATVTQLCISKRLIGSSTWYPIGTLTDIATVGGVKTVRGPSIWIPNETGNFEVKVVGKNSSGTVLNTDTRQIVVAANSPPTVTVAGYATTPPSSDNQYAGTMAFATTVHESDSGDEVTRVEYYDNGALIGIDYEAPFGDAPSGGSITYGEGIVDIRGRHQFQPNALLRGVHPITAKAYDTRGGCTESAAYTVTINSGNARPTLTLHPEGVYFTRQQGDDVLMPFTMQDADGPGNIWRGEVFSSVQLNTTPWDWIFNGTQDGGAIEGTLTRNTQTWQPGGHTLRVMALDQTVVGNDVSITHGFEKYYYVQVNNSQNTNPNPSQRYATADDMATLITAPGSAPVVPYSVRFYGPYAAGQPYTGGTAAGLDASTQPASARQMDTGVLLTTGLFSTWNGNDIADDKSHPWSTPGESTPADKLIHDRIPGAYNRDAVTLEFDVNCLATDASGLQSQLEMELQYGSEEYPEQIGDPDGMGYDAFAVTVDGTLISLVPDGGAPISAKSIHPVIPPFSSEFTLEGQLDAMRGHLFLRDISEINAAAGPTNQVEFDGMTVRLRLHAFVCPGVHKIRISIADRDYPNIGPINEARHDSGVFLRAGSLRTISPTP